MRAAVLRDPGVVFTGMTAAHLLWQVPINGPIHATGRLSSNRPLFRFSEGKIDPDWVTDRSGFRCTNPALTAVDLIPTQGARYVDRVLRDSFERGAESLGQMWKALEAHPHRPGNASRFRILADSRDLPWSEAERRAHQQLRDAGIEGWQTNYEVIASSGRQMFLDIAFPQLRIVVEVDGFGSHSEPIAFHRDRARQNDLVVDGWTVLRVTWPMIEEDAWLHWLKSAISAAERPWALAHKGKRSRALK